MKQILIFFIILNSFFQFSCGYDDYDGEKNIKTGNINLKAEFFGYGKNSDGNESVLVKYYESGDLSTFIDYNSIDSNTNPYIIRTSTSGADDKQNNIIKLTLTFAMTELKNLLINIETDSEHLNSFYVSFYKENEEVAKTTIKSGENDLSIETTIDKIIIYIDTPKFYNSKKLNNYFKFNYCLPFTTDDNGI